MRRPLPPCRALSCLPIRTAAALVVGGLAACATPDSQSGLPDRAAASWTSLPVDFELQPPSWTTVAEAAVGADGLTPRFELQLPAGTDTVALRVSDTGDPGACVQLDTVLDPAALAWVTPPATLADYGSYCLTCTQRVSVGVGGGLYVLPSSDPLPRAAARLQLRAAVRDCRTFLPLDSSGAVRLRIDALLAPAVSDTAEGIIPLEIAITPGSSFYAEPESLPASLAMALEQVNALLRPGHLTVQVVRVRRADSPDPLSIEFGSHAAVDAAFEDLHTCDRDGAASAASLVPLILAGCLQLTDPLQGTSSQPAAFTPRVPDGATAAGRAHGIWIAGRGCQPREVPTAPSPSSLARLITHELGHSLGLYHSEEQDGTSDLLPDTTADNLMYFRPSANAQGLSSEQFRVMRRHPVVRYKSAR